VLKSLYYLDFTPDHGCTHRLRKLDARTRFGLLSFSSLPPPTEKMTTASALPSRLPCNYAENTVSHSSSLVRAVSSDTLSVGVELRSRPASGSR
jgi:hypothetical protein